jgi:AcrR family transcriptional regulator
VASTELTRDRILREALALVNREGLEALTIRRLAHALSSEPTDLYQHVPHQADLLDGLQEAILWGLEAPDTSHSWQPMLAAQGHALWRQLTRHPNAIVLFATRPAATETSLGKLEGLLQALVEGGLSESEALMVFRLTFSFVIGHAIYRFAPGTNTREVEFSKLSKDKFPQLATIAEHGRDPSAELSQGLQSLIDGLSRQLQRT